MAPKKKTTSTVPKKPNHTTSNAKHVEESKSYQDHNSFDTMYVCLTDPNEKRKGILSSLKSALILQEEHERILEVRQTKSKLVKNIRKDMESLNSSYQELKKVLPNIKNALSFTEKELAVLEGSVNMLRSDMKSTQGKIDLEEEIMDNMRNLGSTTSRSEKINPNKEINDNSIKPNVSDAELSRLERIKNNLKVIENKLNRI